MKQLACVLLLLCLALTGCDSQGGGVGAWFNSFKSNNKEENSSVDKNKVLRVEKATVLQEQIPATTLISQAILDDGIPRNANNIVLNAYEIVRDFFQGKKGATFYDQMIVIELYLRHKAGKLNSKNGVSQEPYYFLYPIIAIAANTSEYWNTGDRNSQNLEAVTRAFAVNITRDVYQDIADHFAGIVFSSKEDAIKSINTYFKSLNSEYINKIIDKEYSILTINREDITLDMVSGQGVNFTIGNNSYSFRQDGNTVYGMGADLWGHGWLNGKQTMLAFNKTVGASINESAANQSATKETTESKTEAKAGK